MKKAAFALLASCISAASCTETFANDRPPVEYVPATTLIPKCKIAVLFNEDESSVKESEYMDGAYCLGLVRGVLGVNQHIDAFTPLLCIPQPGIKTWQAAKRIVMYAAERPDFLELSETEFVILALKNTFPCRLAKPDTTG